MALAVSNRHVTLVMPTVRRNVKRLARAAVSIAACAAGLTPTLTLAQPVSASQNDAFLRQHQKELAQYDSTGFSIAFKDERRAFHPGEAIPIGLTFDLQARDDVSPGNYEHCYGLGVADAVLDRTAGAVDPQADLWKNGAIEIPCGIFGGKMGGYISADGVSTFPPVKFDVYLNQAVRFDRPGVYRFYIRSRHRIADDRHYIPPLISNVLTLEIVPRDPAWEGRTLAEALAVIDAPEKEFSQTTPHEVRRRAFETRNHAERILSYLGTDAAVDALVHRFDARPYPLPVDDRIGFPASHGLRGLYGSPNRARVIERMTRELDCASRFISPRFISHLAVLELTRRTTARPIARSRFEARVRELTARRQKVLVRVGR
jgi:hypothetical protein